MIRPNTKDRHYFTLQEPQRTELLQRETDWSDNPIGLVTLYRTYLRKKADGTLETWNDCVLRVIEGMFSFQKTHVINSGLMWDENKAQKTAFDAADRLFQFKWTPPGRGLWMMGTDFVWDRGGAALNNCAFVSTQNIDTELSEPFRFLMDMSMLGVGCGFDTRGAGKVVVSRPEGEPEVFVVPDTREGWVESIGKLIDSYLIPGSRPIELDVSLVRAYGEPIRGFGGVASGSLPLTQGFAGVRDILEKYVGRTLDSVGITDIQNIIGKIVVAGNVRRTAEIAFAEPNDKAFRTMKNWQSNAVETGAAPPPELKEVSEEDYNEYINHMYDSIGEAIVEKYKHEPWAYKFGGWRWASNNSLFATVGMDYSEIAESIACNGEPGLVWLDNMREYGRMKDDKNYRDAKALGANPSLRKGTMVYTEEGIVPIERLDGKTFNVVTHAGEIKEAKCFLSGRDKQLYKVNLGLGCDIYATAEHEWPVMENGVMRKVRTDALQKCQWLPKNPIDARHFGEGSFEDGYALGVFFADGWLTKRSSQPGFVFGIESGNQAQIQAVADAAKRWVGANLTLKVKQREGMEDMFVVSTGNSALATYLQEVFGFSGKEHVPSVLWSCSDAFAKGFLNGLFSTDGSVDKADGRLYLFAKHDTLLQEINKLLGFYGIHASVTSRVRKVSFPNGRDYNTEHDQGQLRMANGDAKRFVDLIGLDDPEKMSVVRGGKQTYNPLVKVQAVEPTDLYEDVWDITVYDSTHTFATEYCVTGNCSEQTLESYELCTLVETYPSKHANAKDYYETLKIAYLYAKTVTLIATHNAKTNTVMCRNRRIGTSQSGIIDAIAKFGRHYYQKNIADAAYEKIEHYDDVYSDWLGVPKSIKKTSVKPSGSVSLLANVSPGIHYPKVRYGYRTMRLAKDSKLVPILQAANYKIETSISDPLRTVVVYFPIVGKEDVPCEADASIWEQFTNAVMMQKYWADNQVSITISFKPEEVKDIAKCLSTFDSELKGVSLLPLNDHGYKQAPYIAADKSEVVAYKKSLLPLDMSQMHALEEGDNAESNKFCDGESCTI